jgi:Rrf2 family protein
MNSRFALAMHVLALLAIEKKSEPSSSEYLARSASTNPVVIRRLLGTLRDAGLVTVQPGTRGGTSLARRPEQITLLEVYRAVGEGELFSLGTRRPNPYCICGRNAQVIANVFSRTETAVEEVLTGITVAQLARDIETSDARPRRSARP